MNRTRGGRSNSMCFVGLEPHLSDKVYTPGVALLRSDQTEGGRIKILSRGNEIGVIQNVDERGLHLKPDSFRDRDSFRHAKVVVEVIRTGEAVHREIPECAGSRSRQQTGLYSRRRN